MNHADAAKKAARWQSDTWAQRLDSCAMLLHMHGFLTDSQNAQVNAKIEKWAAKGGVVRVKPKREQCDETNSDQRRETDS